MNRLVPLFVAALAILAFATLMLVIAPGAQIRQQQPASGLADYTPQQLAGRAQYVSLGCVYCHSQQPRSAGQTLADLSRGWGRAPTSADYAYDRPHQLGTMRTGPDLLNVGARLPSRDWHLTHLYQPRAIFDWSIMPAYPFLFEEKDQAGAGDVVVRLDPAHQPQGKIVVARQEALDLVAYLQSLSRIYPADGETERIRDEGYALSGGGDK
ncbi:MAG: cbb3-type cytochrome c oxidase subunit II [Noviherbaspirillum sp.]